MDEKILEVKNLSLGFRTLSGVSKVIDGINFNIKRGQTFALLGESGCGKSLTAMSILQLLPPQAGLMGQGQILFHGDDISRYSNAKMTQIRGRRIAMIFQEPMTSLNPVQTVGSQIAEVLRLHFQLTRSQITARVYELLESVGISDPTERCHAYPHQLSGGMKQRVMIAMALAGEPDLLIADEPSTALDVTIQAQVLQLLREMQQNTGMSILLITHDLGVVRQMADELAVMYAGHLVEQAPVEAFFATPKHPYSKKLFSALPSLTKRSQTLSVLHGTVPSLTAAQTACRFAGRCEYAGEICYTVAPQWHEVTSGQIARCHLYDEEYAQQLTKTPQAIPVRKSHNKKSMTPVLTANNLYVHFPIRKGLLQRAVASVKAVDGVDFTLYEGRTLALVGESGCGKTTAGRALLRLIQATSGDIRYQDHSLLELNTSQMQDVRRDIQFIFQDPFSSMNPRMLVNDIIAEGLRAFNLCENEHAIEERVVELLELVGLPKEAQWRYPHEFSGGQRQRICIARALAVSPKLIVCDEPTSALDISVQAQILNLLRKLQRRFSYTYLFITHNMSVVGYLADEVAVMYLGRIVEQGPAQTILTQAKHPYTQALLAAVPSIDKKDLTDIVSGETPSPISPPRGCHFHPRCPHAMPVCKEYYPGPTELDEGHWAKCFLYSDEKQKVVNS